MRRAVTMLMVLGLLAAACGDDGDAADDSSPADSETEAEQEPEAEPEQEPETEPESERRDRYVDAISGMFDGAPPEVLDIECLATGIVDGVGLDAFEEAGVAPEDLADADSLEAIGVELTPAIRTAVTAAFNECFDGAVFAEQALASLDLGFPDEVMSCVAGSMDELMSTLVANEFLDATGDFGPASFGDAAQLGATCAAELAADAPGGAVAWAEGSEAFGAALVMRMTTPLYEGAVASRDDEATCFVGAVLDLLGPALSAMPTLTVGDLSLYLSAATTPDAIGLAIDEPRALALAEANVACIDNNYITAQATALTMTALLGVDEGMALRLETCFDETIDDEIWIENLRLNYLHGSDVFDLPEAVPLFETMAQAGEICGARALAPPSGGGRDEFDGDLEAGWSWVSGDPGGRSFTSSPGFLAVVATPGAASQVLVRDPVADDYEIETMIRFDPIANVQAAGLVVRDPNTDDLGDADNAVNLIRAFCDAAPPTCGGDAIYLDSIVNGEFGPPPINVTLPPGTGDVYLRIRHEGGVYTGFYSLDGSDWVSVGSRSRDLVDAQIGIWTGGAFSEPVPTAHFDYFDEAAI